MEATATNLDTKSPALQAMHSSGSSEWYTQPDVLDAVRGVLGGIETDPASCAAAQGLVLARRWCGLAPTMHQATPHGEHVHHDGLEAAWTGGVWLNPPNPARPWWTRAVEHWREDGGQLVYLAYSIDHLQAMQQWARVDQMLVCVPDERLRFRTSAACALAALAKKEDKRALDKRELKRRAELLDMPPDAIVIGEQPTHASALVGLGVRLDRWEREMGALGMTAVVRGGGAA